MTEVQPSNHQQQQKVQLQVAKTRSRPNRSLFGSTLERLTDEELRRLPECDLAEARAVYNDAWKPRERLRERAPAQPLPAELQEFVRARHAPDIELQSRRIDEARRRLRLRERRINLMERDSKYVFDLPHPVETLPSSNVNTQRHPRWMTAEDLNHSAELNPNFMAPGVRNFNRDKYRRLPESHSYALAGDPLRPGMEFDSGGLPAELAPPPPQLPPMPMTVRPDRLVLTPRTQQRKLAMRRLPPSSQLINGVDVPMRLKHQFGSEICEKLLSDQSAVLDTSRRMRERDAQATKAHEPAAPNTTGGGGEQEVGQPAYEQLGNALRTNLFGRGHSLNQKLSSNHRDYNREQFEQRDGQMPEKYRYQKDHVSRWAEANVLEMRMKRALQERMDRMLHKKTDD